MSVARPGLCALLLAAVPYLPLAVTAQQAPCSAPERRAFDFWVGTWDVATADGRLAGTSVVRPVMGGCVLHERYVTPRGYEGESFNVFDASRGVWHQTWVDNGGLLLTLEGGFDGKRMVLQGQTVDTLGAATRQRITWSTLDGDPDRVRQHWEVSRDGGATWSTAFDGRYTRSDGGRPQPSSPTPGPERPGGGDRRPGDP